MRQTPCGGYIFNDTVDAQIVHIQNVTVTAAGVVKSRRSDRGLPRSQDRERGHMTRGFGEDTIAGVAELDNLQGSLRSPTRSLISEPASGRFDVSAGATAKRDRLAPLDRDCCHQQQRHHFGNANGSE